jgi:hypothetical protein
MPPADVMLTEAPRPLRILAYGQSMTKKTTWAMAAAEAGFNVVLLDGDGNAGVAKHINPAAHKRLNIIPVQDTTNIPVFARFVAYALSTNQTSRKFLWDEDARAQVTIRSKASAEHAHYDIDFTKLNFNDVLVTDSWSALCWSVAWQFCLENNIQLDDAKKVEWDGYRWAGGLANFLLNQLQALPCHVIVIGHEELYEKKKTIEVGGKAQQVTEWARIQPKSVSGPHGLQLSKHFGEVYNFTRKGLMYQIDCSGDRYRDGGSRVFPPKVMSWDELQFKSVCEAYGIKTDVDRPPSEAIKWCPPGTVFENAPAKAAAPLGAGTATPAATVSTNTGGAKNAFAWGQKG